MGGRNQPTNDAVDALKKRFQALRRVRGLRDRIERRLSALMELALGDVVCHGQPQLQIRQPACGPADVGNAPIFADVAVLELQLQRAVHDVLGLLPGVGEILRVHHVQNAAPHHLLGGIAKDALKRRTDKDDRAVGLNHADRIQQQIDDVQGGNSLHGAAFAQGVHKALEKPLCRGACICAGACQKPH